MSPSLSGALLCPMRVAQGHVALVTSLSKSEFPARGLCCVSNKHPVLPPKVGAPAWHPVPRLCHMGSQDNNRMAWEHSVISLSALPLSCRNHTCSSTNLASQSCPQTTRAPWLHHPAEPFQEQVFPPEVTTLTTH